MKSIKLDHLYEDWGLYDAIVRKSKIAMYSDAIIVASAFVEQRPNAKKVKILEPFSGPVPYYRDIITAHLAGYGIEVVQYDHLEFLDHGDLTKENGIIVGDAMVWDTDTRYDMVFVPYNSLPCLMNSQDSYGNVLKALANFNRLLNKNGLLLVNVDDFESGVEDLTGSSKGEQRMLGADSILCRRYGMRSATLTYSFKGEFNPQTCSFDCTYGKPKLEGVDVNGNDVKVQWSIANANVINLFSSIEVMRTAKSVGFSFANGFLTLDDQTVGIDSTQSFESEFLAFTKSV